MKLCERIIEQNLIHETNVTKNQFGFLLEKSIMEAYMG